MDEIKCAVYAQVCKLYAFIIMLAGTMKKFSQTHAANVSPFSCGRRKMGNLSIETL